MFVYCGPPIVYLLGIEENRKKTQIILKSKIGVFENKVYKSSKVIHEENIQPFQCHHGGEMMNLSNFYQNYSLETDGSILAWYPNEEGIVMHTIEKQDYCININEKQKVSP